jgi:transposase
MRDLAHQRGRRMRRQDARAAAMIRVDAKWLAVDTVDMRADADRLITRAVEMFEAVQAHHG